jgi:hypothetical protein
MMLGMALAVYINVVAQSMLVTILWSQEASVYVWMVLTLPFVLYWKQHEESVAGRPHNATFIVDPEERPSSRQEQLNHV